jgi:protein-S-isoprenylcysteine O-methyltransferase Ste14
MENEKSTQDKWFGHREDLTGEHAWGDAGQMIFAILFFAVWIIDSFFLKYTNQLNGVIPRLLRIPIGVVLICLAAWCAYSGLKIVFGEVRETPSVIRKGVLKYMRHPMYFSEVMLYLGLFLLNMSLAAGVVGLAAAFFLYHLSRYEERLLLNRFGDDYRSYMRDVGMWIPRLGRK